MHVVARVLLVLSTLALLVMFMATLEYRGVSWNEGLLAIVPLTLFHLLTLRWAKHPPKRLGEGSPAWVAYRRRAAIGLSIFGLVLYLGLGGGSAAYSADQESYYRSSITDARAEARALLRLELDGPQLLRLRDVQERAREAERKARDCGQGVQIGAAYCGVALFPLLGLILALVRRPKPTPGALPIPHAT
jgi:hypothetical protein